MANPAGNLTGNAEVSIGNTEAIALVIEATERGILFVVTKMETKPVTPRETTLGTPRPTTLEIPRATTPGTIYPSYTPRQMKNFHQAKILVL